MTRRLIMFEMSILNSLKKNFCLVLLKLFSKKDIYLLISLKYLMKNFNINKILIQYFSKINQKSRHKIAFYACFTIQTRNDSLISH